MDEAPITYQMVTEGLVLLFGEVRQYRESLFEFDLLEDSPTPILAEMTSLKRRFSSCFYARRHQVKNTVIIGKRSGSDSDEETNE